MSIFAPLKNLLGLKVAAELQKFRDDRAYFLGLRVKLQRANAAWEKKRVLDEAMAAVLDPGRMKMAKMALAPAFDNSVEWDRILDEYDAALPKAIKGDAAAREAVGLRDAGLKAVKKKGEPNRFEQLRIQLRAAKKQADELASRVGSAVALRTSLYQKSQKKIQQAQAIWETAKRQRDIHYRAELFELILRLASDTNTIAVARLRMLKPQSKLIKEWETYVESIKSGMDFREQLEGTETQIAYELEQELNHLRADIVQLKSVPVAA